ncbi:MAG: beta strand repeat-containing protein [Vicinamibacterales bacterium]
MRAWVEWWKRWRGSGLTCAAVVAIVVIGPAAPAAAQSIDLAWDASTETDLAGYRVYVGLASGSYSQSFEVGPTATTFSFVNPAPATRYYFVVTAFNSGGEESPYSNEASAVLGGDNTPPTLTITSPAGAVTVDTPAISLAGTAIDNVDVMPVTWSNNRGGSGTATGTTSWSVASVPLQSGTNVITVTARDSGNNTSQATVTVTYEIPPLTTPVLVSPSGTSSTNRPTFVWNAQPAATHYQLWVNDSAGNGRITSLYTRAQVNCASGVGTCSIAASVTLTGTVIWWVAARNSTGETPWSAPLTFTIGSASDTTAPSLTIGSPAGAVTVTTGTIAVSGTASDNVGVTQVSWTNNRGGSGTASGTTSWSVAGVPLQSGTNTITVTARDAAGNTRSASVTVTYNAPDTTSPNISIASPGNITVTTGTIPMSGTGSDNVGVTQVTWSNNRGGGGTASGTTSWSVSGVALQSGQNVLTVTARDASNNTRSASVTVTYNAPDTTAPNMSITSPGNVTMTTGSVAVTGTASDNVGVTQVTWSNDRGGSGTAAGTASWSVASVALQSGQNIITVTARDAANNTRSASVTVTYNLTLPVAPVLISPSGTSSTATPTFTWNAVAGATGYQLWVNDGSGNGRINIIYSASQTGCGSGTGTCAIAPGTTLTGSVQWWVLSRNASGTSPWSSPLSFTVGSSSDTTAPSVTISSPGTVTVTTGSIAVSGTASDNVGVTQVTWANNRGGSGTASGTTSWSVASVPLQSGTNVITVTARDAAGNTRSASVTVTYNAPDTTQPNISIASPGSITVTTGTIAMSGTASDNVGVTQVTWSNNRGGGGTASGTTSWTVGSVALQSGQNILTVTARDAANNTRSASVTVTYNASDTTPPNIAITTPSGPVTVTVAAASLGGTASDNVGVTQVTWSNDRGGSGTASGTTSWSMSVGLQSGQNVITVTARDAANNTRSASVTVTYNAGARPAPPVLVSPSGTSSTNRPTFVWNAEPAATHYQLWVNDSTSNGRITGVFSTAQVNCASGMGTCSFGATVDLTGTVQWWVASRNSFGESPWSTPLTFTIGSSSDTTAPSVTITSPGNVTLTTGTIAMSGTASDNVGVTQVTWSNNRGGGGTASGTTSWSVSGVALQSGQNVLTVTARDAASNTRSASVTITYNAPDTTPPTIAITTPSGPVTVTVPAASLGGTASDNVGVTQVTWSNNRGGSGTAGGTTSWSMSIGLQSGQNVITVTARDAANNTRSASVTITYGTSTVPAPPVLISPSGSSSTATPTFIWNASAGATGYQLWVNDAAANGRINTIYTATQTGCGSGSGTCAIAPGVALTGNVQWWVLARNSAGQSPWSTPLSFTVGSGSDTTVPSLVITSPADGAMASNPAIAVSGTASDNVGVTQVAWSNDRGGSGTASGTTSWSATGVTLQAGTNVITVTARDAASNTRQASLTLTYDAGGGSAPAAPVLVSPSGSQSTYTPSFVWNAVSNATHYQLWVNDGRGNGRVQALYAASQVNCGGGAGTCSVNPGVALTGSGQWWVASRNAVGESPWSNPLSFTIAGTSSLTAPTLLSPSGTGSSRPTFSWTAVPSATNYLLWVNDSNGNGRVQWNLSAAQANCAHSGPCRATPGVTLAGTATWWVQPRNGTEGPWSVPLTFQVR